MSTNRPHLGILVKYNPRVHPPFAERGFFKILTIQGQKLGIDVTVFSPPSVRWEQNRLTGYRYNVQQRIWQKGSFPIPTLLYDRIFYSNRQQIVNFAPYIQGLLHKGRAIMLGRGLPGKWKVYHMFKDVKELKPFIPETNHFYEQSDWKANLKKYGSLFFKPASGSHGKGVMKVSLTKKGIRVQGRSSINEIYTKTFHSAQSCHEWLKKQTHKRSYIYQPYLELSTKDELPFDIRVLIQKNHEGQWEESGRAARVGKKSGLTSNLHGGGTAVDASTFIKTHFEKGKAREIDKQISTITSLLPKYIEKKHGPLVELGIDIGIDRQGNAWIIEVNSKPGRKSFQLSKNNKALTNAILAPIRYANYIASQDGGSIHQ